MTLLRRFLQTATRHLLFGWRYLMSALGWGTDPAFMLIGAQRSGTTALFDYLCTCEQIAAPSAKETDFFADHYSRGLNYYRAHFPIALFSRKRKLTGEGTPHYLLHPDAPRRIARHYPHMRFIVLLRDPVARAFSQYLHELRMGRESLDFPAAIDAEPSRLAGEEEKLVANPDYRSFAYRNHSYVERGLYARQLERWFRYFPREQFLIVRAEEFYVDADAVVAKALHHIGISGARWRKPANYEIDALSQDRTIDPATVEKLRSRFAEDQERCVELLGPGFFADPQFPKPSANSAHDSRRNEPRVGLSRHESTPHRV